ncbi:MAG: DUF4339 domain-containing protein [Hyphomicrobiaceae bacterium]
MSHYSLNYFAVAEPPDPHSERVWLVDRHGQRAGPLSGVELAFAAKNGLLDENDFIWKSGLPCWYRAAEIEGLLPKSARTETTQSEPAIGSGATRQEQPARTGITGYYSAARPLIDGAHTAKKEATTADPAVGRPTPASLRMEKINPRSPVPHSPPIVQSRMAAAPAQEAAKESSQLANGPDQDSVTRKIADSIAHEIVVMLDRNNIKTVDDLTSNDRLHQLAGFTFDALPTAIRFTLSSTIGRPRIEAHIFDALVMLRAALMSPGFRSMDLRQVAANQGPAIAVALDTAITQAAAGFGTVVSSKWNSVFNSIWGPSSNPPPQGAYPALAPAE